MPTLHAEIRDFIDELLYSGNTEWAERLNNVVSYTSSGTELLMGVRSELGRALLTGDLLNPEHEATAKYLIDKVDSALRD